MTTKPSNNKEAPFYISRRARRGVYVFVICCLALVFIPRLLLRLNPPISSQLTTEEMVSFHESHKNAISNKSKENKGKKSRFKLPPQKFDPAQYSLAQWMYLGLSEKQSNVVIKFSSRGIKNEDQLRQIFVIPEQLFLLIKDSVIYSIVDPITPVVNTKEQLPKKEIKALEINSASKEELERLKGIGPYLSAKIIEYRTKLGGFIQVEQLQEVYKMTPELIESIKPFIKLDPSIINQINVNSCSTEELNAHPYLNWNQSNSIVKIRLQRGSFKSLNELKESVLIDEKTYKKILPYVTL